MKVINFPFEGSIVVLKEWNIFAKLNEKSHNLSLDLTANKISYIDGLGNDDVVPLRKRQLYNFEDLASLKQTDNELWNITEQIRHMLLRVILKKIKR